MSHLFPVFYSIFGSSMFNLHLTPEGQVRKDIDFVIDGIGNIEKLQIALPDIRHKLGFREVSESRQLQQCQRYQKVFQNNYNTLPEIIRRRWSGLQLSAQIVSTIRFRDKNLFLPFELVQNATMLQKDIVVAGRVIEAEKSNLFPRIFTLETEQGRYQVYILWWKFSTPVCEHDCIHLCGDKILLNGEEVLRMTNFHTHWLAFDSSI